MQTFHLPDVGEGLTEAELVAWRVKPGDTLAVNDVVADIETAKSVVELPSPYAGVVGELLVTEGETVDVGTAIITIADDAPAPVSQPDQSEPAGEPKAAPEAPSAPSAASAPAKPAEPERSGSVLVGYGSGGDAATRRRRKRPEAADGKPGGVLAKPPVRKLARDLGVELADVRATGSAGEVTRDDVVRHAEQASVFRNISTPEWPAVREEKIPVAEPAAAADALWEMDPARVESIPVKGVRKATANAMVGSAYTAPHVSVWTDVDATRTMEYVKRLKASPDFADVKVSPLLIMARAVIWAVRRTPMINAAWVEEEDGAKIHVRHYVNLGIAAATPRGLLVPNIKDAQDLSMRDLARALENLTVTARDGKTTPEDQRAGTITITNIGVFGMDAGTPIINPGEAGIIAMGAIRQKPWVVDGEVRPRWVTTVSGSFDHRIIDGDKISRFIADIASVLEEPALLLD
ncbi:dihydrolipoamide acetyltransferase family protein [Microbacterium oryzae]|uniref:Dihydrolipoamide acetyltransferase component of pyruvate dehydrogenase complex n=1 Tax=Microbacterium oryzae TaxID=743009 RepID=A0A6I6E6A6_9MICO|nr:dihydrolipoamide acetyltransferase family protein [Microbacterium oryzae]QGU27970.1 2-oxo acid dehydrogenase subunit E2 [Microbacterium oryzae]